MLRTGCRGCRPWWLTATLPDYAADDAGRPLRGRITAALDQLRQDGLT
ncbi:MAG TPA: hypothetical protein VIJ00_14625 [Nakamurella sp.]